jgi:hypothetical protein
VPDFHRLDRTSLRLAHLFDHLVVDRTSLRLAHLFDHLVGASKQ